jgi:capsular polysaccharide biosynthesis protein
MMDDRHKERSFMEIIDYLRIARRRIWVLVLVPVVAAVAAAAFILLQPTQYNARAIVLSSTMVGDTSSPYSGPQGVSQFVAAFNAAAQSPTVRAAVASVTGVTPARQADNVAVGQLGTSSDMTITYTSTKENEVAQVLSATTKQVLTQMFTGRADKAKTERDMAQQSMKDANAALANLNNQYHIADPLRAYQAQLAQVGALQQQQATLRATGNAIGAAALDAPITAAQKVLDGYGPILAAYNDLAAVQQAATNDLTQAQADYRHAVSLQAAAANSDVTYIGDVAPVDRSASLLTTVLPVFGAGIFVAVFLVMILEMLARARRAPAIMADLDEMLRTVSETEPSMDAPPVQGSASPGRRDVFDPRGDDNGERLPSNPGRTDPSEAREPGAVGQNV